MRRLAQPPCVQSFFSSVWFKATWEDLKPLGEVHYIETDSMATAGPPEYFWNFETEDGLRFSVMYDDAIHRAAVSADPPDADWIIRSLRAAGLNVTFEPREAPEEVRPRRRIANGVVWLFTGTGATGVTAAFSQKSNADAWLKETRFNGVLRPHAIDTSTLKADRGWREILGQEIPPASHQTYVGEIGEIYEYENGAIVSGYETWLLCRQDDNGQKFEVEEFRQRSRALAAQQQFEARGHRQMYWVEPKPFQGTISPLPKPYRM